MDELNLDLKNAEAISRCEAMSLIDHTGEPDEMVPRNPFSAPLSDEDGISSWIEVLRRS